MKTNSLFCGFTACLLSLTAAATDGSWKTSGDGVYTNDANWTSGVFPGASSDAYFDISSVKPASGEFLVKFEGDVTDYNKTCVRTVTAGVPLVFAVTNGASWYKGPGCFYDNYHTMGFGLCQGSGQTGDNLSIRPSAYNTTQPCFKMTDALLSYTINSTGNLISFSKGTWNWYDPSGTASDSPANTMYVGYGRNEEVDVTDGLVFTVAADATLRGRGLEISRGTMEIEGGHHLLAGTLAVGHNQKKSTTLLVKGGSLKTGVLQLGIATKTQRASDATGVDSLVLSGAAAVTNTGFLSVQAAPNAMARVELRDSSSLVTAGFALGNGNGSSRSGVLAHLLVTNSAALKTTAGSQLGYVANAVLEVAGSGTYRYAVNNSFSIGSYKPGALWVKDDAKATLSCPIVMQSYGTNGKCELIVSGRGKLSWAAPESGTAGNGYHFYLGSSTAANNRRNYFAVRDSATFNAASMSTIFYMYGTNTLAELAGGNASFYQIMCHGGTTGDCRLRVTGGSHTISSAAYFGYTTDGTESVYEQTGGTWTCGSAVALEFAKTQSSTATGRCVLTGGVLAGKVNGGYGAAIRGGKGRAELYADGGTVKTLSAAAAPYVGYFDEAVLGEKGLTFDSAITTADPRADIRQAFTDESGKTGLFVKTGTGVANFYTTSAHGRTAIAGGTAYFKSGVTRFGRELVVTNGATLDVAQSVTAERLTLGDAATSGTLTLPADAVVTLTGDDAFSAPNGMLDCALAATKGTYTVFRLTGTVNRAAFLPVRLAQSSATLHYAFQFVADGDDTLVNLVTYEVGDVTDANWQGATGVYETPGNWAGGAAAGVTNSAVFPAGAAVKDVTIADQTTVDNMVFQGGDYTIRGSKSLKSFGFSVTAGTADILAPLFAVGSLALEVAAGTELTLEGALAGNFTAVKTGKGLLTLASEESTATSDWTLSEGKTVVGPLAALGDGTLTVGRATVRFTEAGEAANALVVAPGADQAAVIDAAADVTFDGGLTATSGGSMKTGAGALTVNYPAGTYYLAKSDLGLGRNVSPGNSSTPMSPVGDDGEVTNTTGLAGFTVREGKVRLAGAGAAKTTLKQAHPTLVGAQWQNTAAPAVLEIANMTFDNSYTDYRRVQIGLRPIGGAEAYVNPLLRVCDGAVFKAQGVMVGSDATVTGGWHPTFEITNATAEIQTSLYVGQDSKWHQTCYPTVRILDGADVYVYAQSASLGVMLGQNSDVTVDGGTLRCGTNNGGLIFSLCSSGSLTVRNGGILKVPGVKSTGVDNSAYGTITVTLDGGTLEFTTSRSDAISAPDRRDFTLGADGGTVCAGSGVSYALRLPVKGSGAFTKSGAGEIVIGVGKKLNSTQAAEGTAVVDSGLVTAQWTGLTTVAEGKLTFEETSSVASRAFAVAAGATLDLGGYAGNLVSVSGGGTVTNATVGNLTIKAARPDETPVMTELDVALEGKVTVDFGVQRSEEVSIPSSPVAVAKLGTGASFVAGNWKSTNRGRSVVVSFSCTDGIVYATFKKARGFAIFFR